MIHAMENLEIIMEEASDYDKRMRSSLRLITGVSFILFIIVTITSRWFYAIPLALFVFVVQYLKAKHTERFFITHLKIENHLISISYKEENTLHTIEGYSNSISVKKKLHLLNKTRSVYLEVCFGKIVIKQNETEGWNENKFDEIIKATLTEY